jgi:integrase
MSTPDQNFAAHIRQLQTAATAKGYTFAPKARQNVVHNFRRSFATILNSCYGLSAPTVQHRIGDSSLATTSRYLGLVDDPRAMQRAFERIPFGPTKR